MAILAKNSKASYDYDIKQTLHAGLVLSGAEVKSVKEGNVSMAGSYVTVSPGSVNLVSCHVGAYKYAKNAGYDPTHTRKLLLNKKEIDSLLGKEKGLVIIPLEIYATPRGLLKLKIGLGRSRKKLDKREYIKKKESDKEIRSAK